MVDKYGKEIKKHQLVLVKSLKHRNGKYFYIEKINEKNEIYGKRVNKDLSFNRHDINGQKKILVTIEDEIEIIEKLPDKFKDSLRTLHFFIDELCEEFGVLISKKEHYILRAVKYENGSYGIIQNRLYSDNSGIDLKFELCNAFLDMTYKELKEKWNKIKSRTEIEWIEEFIC